MTRGGLDNRGVLVTRPATQARDQVDAIRAAGGKPWRFPVMDIVARDREEIAAELDTSVQYDIVIFVSANAARFGISSLGHLNSRIAAIGSATAAALRDEGAAPDLSPAGGFRSEDLLAEKAMKSVDGQRILIVRGDRGRELLAETLRHRGAEVDYLSVYRTVAHRFTAAEIESVSNALAAGQIVATIVMSVATFDYLLDALPEAAIDRLAGTRLVAPGARVIQTLAERLPGATCVEAPAADAEAIVGALLDSLGDEPPAS